jgi:hypothetical protein
MCWNLRWRLAQASSQEAHRGHRDAISARPRLDAELGGAIGPGRLADSDGATEWLRVLGGGASRGLAFKFPQGPGSMPRHMAATGAALGGGVFL